jgi:hypothetical protein
LVARPSRRAPDTLQGRSSNVVVHSSRNVNFWIAQPPTADGVRPGSCPGCGRASRVPGKPLGLVGHGLRSRQLRGPPAAEDAPATRVVQVRRYLCRGCGAVITVVPRHVVPRRHFSAGAIAIALFVFGTLRAPAAIAAERVGSWARGAGAWRTLRRWIDALDDGRLFPRIRAAIPGWSPRRRAARAAVAIGAIVPAMFATTELGRVFEGAARAG